MERGPIKTFRIENRYRYGVNTDPQRRCYDGCHFSIDFYSGLWYIIRAGREKHKQPTGEDGMERYHVTVVDDQIEVAGHMLQNAMKTSDGTYRGVIDIEDGEDCEYLEEMLSDDSNVVEWDS